jgi:hypothetical protein
MCASFPGDLILFDLITGIEFVKEQKIKPFIMQFSPFFCCVYCQWLVPTYNEVKIKFTPRRA